VTCNRVSQGHVQGATFVLTVMDSSAALHRGGGRGISLGFECSAFLRAGFSVIELYVQAFAITFDEMVEVRYRLMLE
jgi:hypothetical protein